MQRNTLTPLIALGAGARLLAFGVGAAAHEDMAAKADALCWRHAYETAANELREMEIVLLSSDGASRAQAREWGKRRMPRILDAMVDVARVAAANGASPECLSAHATNRERIRATFSIDR